MQRRRFKYTLTFPDRLAKAAEHFREEAESNLRAKNGTIY